MAKPLHHKRALVTGASRGIGAATAQRLAAEGADVALVARTGPPRRELAGSLEETAARLARFGQRVLMIEADLSDPQSRADIVSRAAHGLGGPIDILVNNAAAGIYRTLSETSRRHRTKMLEVNLNAPLDLMQAVLPGMRERGEGWIVNVSSADAQRIPGPPFQSSPLTNIHAFYGTTKAALDRLSNGFAVEVFEHRIRCNSVAPRAAVATEGALAKGLDGVPADMIEPVEAIVEAIFALCTCDHDRTGQCYESLDLIQAWGRDVRSLDGETTPSG